MYIIEPFSTHTHSVIFLHGLGSNGQKFGAELLETALQSDGKGLKELLPGARFIFPTAKRRRSSAFSRSKLTQWFDIASLDDPSYRRHTQAQGLEESLHEILDILNQERAKVSQKNILLGGLSQGSAMGVVCLLAMEFPIGGFVGMSGWMPYQQDIQDLLDEDDNPFGSESGGDDESGEKEPVVKAMEFIRDLLSTGDSRSPKASHSAITTPILLGHGSLDEKVVPSLGESVRDTLRDIGFNVQWKAYEGQGHWYMVPDQIDDLADFMQHTVGWELGATRRR